jgi:hypothetical protein
MRTRLSDEYTRYLDGHVSQEVERLVAKLILRLAEHTWIHYPDAARMLIASDDVTGRAEPVQILDADSRPLWSTDGPGWEPGGDNGPLHSLKPGDAADRHGARIHHDIALLGPLLPEMEYPDSRYGTAHTSAAPGADWELVFPVQTDRRQFNVEVKLDEEAGVS